MFYLVAAFFAVARQTHLGRKRAGFKPPGPHPLSHAVVGYMADPAGSRINRPFLLNVGGLRESNPQIVLGIDQVFFFGVAIQTKR